MTLTIFLVALLVVLTLVGLYLAFHYKQRGSRCGVLLFAGALICLLLAGTLLRTSWQETTPIDPPDSDESTFTPIEPVQPAPEEQEDEAVFMPIDVDDEAGMVYTSDNDDYYHSPDCEELVGTRYETPVWLAKEQGYEPCPKCQLQTAD